MADPLRTTESVMADPFQKENGYPSFIPRDLIEKHKFSIEWAPGENTARDFRVSRGLLIVTVPPFFHPPLEYGDHILSINNDSIKGRDHFKKVIKQACQTKHPTICFEVERIQPATKLSRDSPKVLSIVPKVADADDYANNCEYYEGVMVLFPKAVLGVGIKSLEKKVYIESTDNGFNSIGRRIFFIGDCILSVEGVKCELVSKTSEYIREALRTKRMVRVVLERAVEPIAVNYVKGVLMLSKNQQKDPKMQDDVIALCKLQLRQMKKEAKE